MNLTTFFRPSRKCLLPWLKLFEHLCWLAKPEFVNVVPVLGEPAGQEPDVAVPLGHLLLPGLVKPDNYSYEVSQDYVFFPIISCNLTP